MKTVKSSISPKSTLKMGKTVVGGKTVGTNHLQPATIVNAGIFHPSNTNVPKDLTFKPRANK